MENACGRQAEAQRSAETAKAKHDEALMALETDRGPLARDRTVLEERAAELAAEAAALASRTGTVLAQEREVMARESAVRAGLFDEQQKALATLRAQVEALETQRQQLPFAIEEERQVQLAAARTLAQGDFDGAHARSVSARARSFNSRRHPQGARLSR